MLNVAFNSGDGVMSATITLKVPNLDYEWSHTFKSGDKIQVPGLPLKIEGVANSDMYLMLKLVKGKMGVAFKVIYYVKVKCSPCKKSTYILLDSFLGVNGFAYLKSV